MGDVDAVEMDALWYARCPGLGGLQGDEMRSCAQICWQMGYVGVCGGERYQRWWMMLWPNIHREKAKLLMDWTVRNRQLSTLDVGSSKVAA